MIIKKLLCEKCGHSWIPRTKVPLECPNCKTRSWNGKIKGDKDDL